MYYTINSAAGVCSIKDGYLITSKAEMLRFINEHLTTAPFNKRSVKSYLREWRAHNLLYIWKFRIEDVKDIDLDVNEARWRRFGYLILSLLYPIFR